MPPAVAGSSNGRTPGSGPGSLGSNPSPAASAKPPETGGFCLYRRSSSAISLSRPHPCTPILASVTRSDWSPLRARLGGLGHEECLERAVRQAKMADPTPARRSSDGKAARRRTAIRAGRGAKGCGKQQAMGRSPSWRERTRRLGGTSSQRGRPSRRSGRRQLSSGWPSTPASPSCCADRAEDPRLALGGAHTHTHCRVGALDGLPAAPGSPARFVSLVTAATGPLGNAHGSSIGGELERASEVLVRGASSPPSRIILSADPAR